MKPVRIPIIQEKTMTERTTMEPIMEHMTKMVIHMVHMMVTTINNLYVRWDSIKGGISSLLNLFLRTHSL